ncbi:filamentous hemeagglutinin family domain protein, partial [Helicobacter pullorum MIT 98-5489]
NTKNSKPQKLTKNPKKIQESQKDSKTISKIGISIIASVLLSQNLAALPAGGKFIHGSGSISIKNDNKNGNKMTITGNNKNHVIAWGGGFNINNGETVEFAKGGKAFLNLDYSNKASKILGNLNGNDNNIYLVNPSGVLIGKGVNVNANRFVASTTSLDKALQDFTNNASDDKNVANFSPVFSRNLQGNIVNMGNIKANYITLVGNEVRNLASQNENDINGTRGTFTPKDSNINSKVHLIGKKIFLDADGAVNMKNIEVTGFNPLDGNTNPDITVQMAMSTFASKKHNIDNWIQQTYTTNGIDRGNGSMYVHNIITIGVEEGWNNFANAWNSGLGITRQIEEFKLIGNLNFENKDFVSVGTAVNSGFNKIFNGNGYKMS